MGYPREREEEERAIMITRELSLLVGSLLCLQLACEGHDLPENTDEAPANVAGAPVEQGAGVTVACSRVFVTTSSHPAARLRLLADTLSIQMGEPVDLRSDTPPGAAECRLHLREGRLRD
jgi:hypothetical protein